MPSEIPKEYSEKVSEEKASSTSESSDQVIQLAAQLEEVTEKSLKLFEEVTDLNSKLEKANKKNTKLTHEVSELIEQNEKLNSSKTELTEEVTTLKKKLKKSQSREQEKTKKLRALETQSSETAEKLTKIQSQFSELEKISTEREQHLLIQNEAMAEQIEKLRGVIKKRDEELVNLQKDILTKKDAARDAQEEADQLRTVGIVQREAVQDTTVLRRRVTDLEVELEQLKKALEKDPKYRIYLLVRETGQRTLEELSKILGVGVFEARRRVQELVRTGLLELKDDKVTISRRTS